MPLKLNRRPDLTVCWHERRETESIDGGLYVEVLSFRFRYMHKRGSNRPKGYYHDGFGHEDTVTVRWLWTERLEHFACEITYYPTALGIKANRKIGDALLKIGRRASSPELLCETLEVLIVEDVPNEGDAYDDYRPVRIVGEPCMVTLARAAL